MYIYIYIFWSCIILQSLDKICGFSCFQIQEHREAVTLKIQTGVIQSPMKGQAASSGAGGAGAGKGGSSAPPKAAAAKAPPPSAAADEPPPAEDKPVMKKKRV